MLVRVRPPPWVEMRVVVAVASFGPTANVRLMHRQGAFGRTWRFEHGQA
jgi:hypothetical protein